MVALVKWLNPARKMKLATVYITAFSLIALCVCTFTAVGQTKHKKPLKTKEEYLSQSMRQKTGGWVAIGVGAVLFGTGAAIDRGELIEDGFLFDEYRNDKTKLILKGLGFTSMIAGAIVLIIARTTKNKAAKVAFKSNPIQFMHSSEVVTAIQPGLLVTINF